MPPRSKTQRSAVSGLVVSGRIPAGVPWQYGGWWRRLAVGARGPRRGCALAFGPRRPETASVVIGRNPAPKGLICLLSLRRPGLNPRLRAGSQVHALARRRLVLDLKARARFAMIRPLAQRALLAQLAEQLTLNQRVEGSSPSGGIGVRRRHNPTRCVKPLGNKGFRVSRLGIPGLSHHASMRLKTTGNVPRALRRRFKRRLLMRDSPLRSG